MPAAPARPLATLASAGGRGNLDSGRLPLVAAVLDPLFGHSFSFEANIDDAPP